MATLAAESKANPTDPVLYFKLADLQGLHGDAELALKNLERVDELAPGKFPTDLLRGQALLETKEFARASEALDRQVTAYPESARGWLLRARARRHLGQHEASLADYREALKRTTSLEPDVVQEVAGALAERGHQAEAAEVVSAGIEKLGKIPSLVLRALELEIKARNFDGALRRIEEAQRAAPRPEPWMARRAAILRQAGRIDESHVAWKALIKHLDSLPDGERGSRAMSKAREDAQQAVASLGTDSTASAITGSESVPPKP